MATISITIPDAQLTRVLDGMCPVPVDGETQGGDCKEQDYQVRQGHGLDSRAGSGEGSSQGPRRPGRDVTGDERRGALTLRSSGSCPLPRASSATPERKEDRMICGGVLVPPGPVHTDDRVGGEQG